jgi:hypothetical protein
MLILRMNKEKRKYNKQKKRVLDRSNDSQQTTQRIQSSPEQRALPDTSPNPTPVMPLVRKRNVYITYIAILSRVPVYSHKSFQLEGVLI